MLLSDEDVVRNLARDPWPLSVEDARDIICRPRDRLLPHLFITVPGHSGASVTSRTRPPATVCIRSNSAADGACIGSDGCAPR